MLVNIGERYWIVTAEASGIFCSVVKKQKSANVPKNPRKSKSFRLEPFQSPLIRRNPIMQKTAATEHRKKTTSIAGMCETSFTKTFAKPKASVDKNIARTPSVKNGCSLLNPHLRLFPFSRSRNHLRILTVSWKTNADASTKAIRHKPKLPKLLTQL